MRMFDTITNLRAPSHPRRRTKQKATRTAWQRMAEHFPTMTIVYHNVLPGTLGGYAFLPFGDPTVPVSPQSDVGAAVALRTLFVSNTTKNYKTFTHPLTKPHTPPKNFKKIPQHFVKYLTYPHKKIPAHCRDNGKVVVTLTTRRVAMDKLHA